MKYTTNHRINVRTVRKLSNGDGFTLRNGKLVEYRGGWQVSTQLGVKVFTAEEAMVWVRWFSKRGKNETSCRNVGVWYNDGIYYVDCGNRVPTKKEAVKQGREANQISIYSWGRKKNPVLYL